LTAWGRSTGSIATDPVRTPEGRSHSALAGEDRRLRGFAVVLIAAPGECLGRCDAQLASKMGQARLCWPHPSIDRCSTESGHIAAPPRTGASGQGTKSLRDSPLRG